MSVESNNAMLWLFNIHPGLFLGVKLATPAAFILVAIYAARKNFRVVLWGTAVLFAGYCLIVGWNVWVTIKAVGMPRGF